MQSLGPNAKRSLIQRMLFAIAACETAVGFGTPLEPEVKITYASELGTTRLTEPSGQRADRCRRSPALLIRPTRGPPRPAAPPTAPKTSLRHRAPRRRSSGRCARADSKG